MAAKREQELRLFELASAKLSEAQKLMAEARDLLKQGLTNVTNARQEKSAIEEITITLNEVHFASTIRLNVGGKIYKTTLDTLRKDPDSILSAMFSGRIELKADEDDGAYFIDLDAELFRDKLKVANEELQKKKAYIDSLEPKVSSSEEKVNELQELLTKKDQEMKVMEVCYKKYLEKAKIVHHLQVQVSDLQRRADKAEFEAKKAKEKVSNLDGENERLRQERVKLREENEELQLAQVTGSLMHQLSPGTPPSDDFDLGSSMSPEVKERILRLEHENKKLKEQKQGEQEEQNQLLQSLLNDANERKDQLEKENRELDQKLMEAESELDDIRYQKSAGERDNDTELGKKYTDHLDKLKVASKELQKKKAYIDSLKPKVSSSVEKVNELQELLNKKYQEMKVMEDRYKKYLEKAKSVIKTLDPKKNAGSQPEVQLLQNQVREKDKIIEQLERDYEKMKITREREEKRAVSAWYELGIQLHRKAAEERLPGNTGGMSFLAREGQASSPRFSPNRTQQADAVSSRELNQKPMEADSELDDIRNQKSAGEMGKDSELGKNYTDHL